MLSTTVGQFFWGEGEGGGGRGFIDTAPFKDMQLVIILLDS